MWRLGGVYRNAHSHGLEIERYILLERPRMKGVQLDVVAKAYQG